MFYQPPNQRKSELVFSSNTGDSLFTQNVESCFSDDSQLSTSQTSTNETKYEEEDAAGLSNTLKFINKAMFHRVAMAIKEALDNSKGIKGTWPPSPSDFTLNNIKEGIPIEFFIQFLGFNHWNH